MRSAPSSSLTFASFGEQIPPTPMSTVLGVQFARSVLRTSFDFTNTGAPERPPSIFGSLGSMDRSIVVFVEMIPVS